jgi:hypothetical protein
MSDFILRVTRVTARWQKIKENKFDILDCNYIQRIAI